MTINPHHARALQVLRKALALATDSGLTDVMGVLSKPEVANDFIKAFTKAEAFVLQTVWIEGFNVRIVVKGDAYGRNDCLIHDGDEPLVEFYDAKQDIATFGPRGQFVSRYYCKTILESDLQTGLQLDGGVPQWSISPTGMRAVREYIRQLVNL